MEAPKVFLLAAAGLLALLALLAPTPCGARHLAASDARLVGLPASPGLPEDDMDTVFSLEEQQQQVPALPPQPPAFPVTAERLAPYIVQDDEAVPHPLSKRSTVVFRPLFATRERDAERRVAHERRREYWANEERRRSAVARPGPAQYQPYRPYAPAYAPGYPALG